MTTLGYASHKCSRCGRTFDYTEVTSTNSFGATDLDTRPPQMKRSTMRFWVHECPVCGYVADVVSNKTTAPDELFSSEEYLSYGGIAFQSKLAKMFYRFYLVKRAEGDAREAFWAALYCAWASDDELDETVAVQCRRIALDLLEKKPELESSSNNYKLIKLDLLRRVREFDAVGEYAATLHFGDDFLTRIVALQTKLAKQGDDACHRCDEA